MKHILCAVAFTGSTSQEGDFSFRAGHSFPFNKADSQRTTHGSQPAPVSTFISFGFMLSCDRRDRRWRFTSNQPAPAPARQIACLRINFCRLKVIHPEKKHSAFEVTADGIKAAPRWGKELEG
jgi:hypothetical protein